MSYTYTKIADYIIDQLWGYQSANLMKNNIRFLAEDILNDPFSNNNQVSMGSRTPGWTSNLKLKYSSGVLTITDWDDEGLSPSNPGWVACESSANDGSVVLLKVTAPITLQDDTHATSNMTGIGFGITETQDWGERLPMFIKVANVNNTDIDGVDGNSAFFIQRFARGNRTSSSSNTFASKLGGPVSDTIDSIMLMGNYTVSSYTSKRVQLVGVFAMTWLASTTDWTFTMLNNNNNSGGIGLERIRRFLLDTWNYPPLQNGANTTTGAFQFLQDNGGTAPRWSNVSSNYTLDMNDTCRYGFSLTGDGGADGAGVVAVILTAPIATGGSTFNGFGIIEVNYAGASNDFFQTVNSGNNYFSFRNRLAQTLNNSDFSNGTRTMQGTIYYTARG